MRVAKLSNIEINKYKLIYMTSNENTNNEATGNVSSNSEITGNVSSNKENINTENEGIKRKKSKQKNMYEEKEGIKRKKSKENERIKIKNMYEENEVIPMNIESPLHSKTNTPAIYNGNMKGINHINKKIKAIF